MTPEKTMKYGHVAATLRQWLKQNDKKTSDLNDMLGRPRNNSSVFNYVAGRSAPNKKYRAMLSKKTGIPEADLMRKKLNGAMAAIATRHNVIKTNDNISFVMVDSAQARIKFDIILPAAKAISLLQVIIKETS